MNICSDWSHSEIVHTENKCPLCEALKEVEKLKEELEEAREKLEVTQ